MNLNEGKNRWGIVVGMPKNPLETPCPEMGIFCFILECDVKTPDNRGLYYTRAAAEKQAKKWMNDSTLSNNYIVKKYPLHKLK